MSRKITSPFVGLDDKALEGKIEELRRELFGLRLNASTNPVKDYSQFKKLRKDIARGLTFLQQRRQGLHVASVEKE